MAALLFRLENRESQQIERPGGVPAIECAIHTDEEGAFRLVGAISVVAM
jgi:hypothetical protein